MVNSFEAKKRNEFYRILIDLSLNEQILESSEKKESMYRRLEDLYYSEDKKDKYRHFYSDIFLAMTSVEQAKNEKLGSIDILGENLKVIRENYEPHNYDSTGNLIDISANIQKLYDHVSLEIARIRFADANYRNTIGSSTINNINSQLNNLKNDIEIANNNQKDILEKSKKQQQEYIAILGIFASIVLTFTAGIAYSTSVLENINSISPYRIILISLIIGLVLINALFGLFYYIDRLVNGNDNVNNSKVKPMVITNLILLILIAFTLFAWNYRFIERRNNQIYVKNEMVESLIL